MIVAFEKYHGTGNDFILIDDRDKLLDENNVEWVKRIAVRKFGVGADGVMLIRNHLEYDFEMIFFNPDGSKSFCGNGSRCAVAFAKKIGMIKLNETVFLTNDGVHKAKLLNDKVAVEMRDVKGFEQFNDDYFINTGSPHYIKYVADVAKTNVLEEGRNIRYSENYRVEGTNVNFLEIKNETKLSVRTYERGVENETLSCGSGVTAAALSLALKKNITQGTVQIETSGGNLSVSFKRTENGFTDIWLTAPATYVFKGEIEI